MPKKPPHFSFDAEKIFYTALDFERVAKTLGQKLTVEFRSCKENGRPRTFIPWLVNHSFASELYLKCLGQLINKSFLGTHDLSLLFDDIRDPAIMRRMQNAYRRKAIWSAKSFCDAGVPKVEHSHLVKALVNFRYALSLAKNNFSSSRYWFQYEQPEKMVGFEDLDQRSISAMYIAEPSNKNGGFLGLNVGQTAIPRWEILNQKPEWKELL